MKKQMVLWTFLAVMTWTFTAAAQVRTVTLNYNYSGAPENITVQTDAHGSLMMPLPSPRRDGQAFTGWFTTATGGNNTMVLAGATGTKFNSNTTIFARWTPLVPVNMASIPAAFKENFDWLRYTRHEEALPGYNTTAERIYFNANGSVRQRNSVFHMIWEGNGTVNWAVRWESNRRITLAERQNMARMLHESINVWTRPLIGMPNWPFGEIQVNLVGWAVSDANVIVDRQPNEQVWVNRTHNSPLGDPNFAAFQYMASAPSELSRFIQFGGSGRVNTTYNYPGGLNARFDMYQWVSAGFGGAVGGDWGNRLSDSRVIGYGSGVNASGANTLNGVQTHEVGHSFGLYDLYTPRTRMPPDTRADDGTGNRVFGRGNLRTVMDGTYNGPLNSYDQWQIRYYWDWVYNATPTNDRNRLFPMRTVTVSGGGTGATGGGSGYAAGNTVVLNAGTRSGFTFTGWTVSGTGVTLANANSPTTTFAMPAGNVTATANWTSAGTTGLLHIISFNSNGGTGTMTSDDVQGGNSYTIKANTFTRAGHTFTGWRTAASGGTSYAAGATIPNVQSNITLFAQWTPITYTVSFNANGGAGTMTSDNVNHGSNYTIKANTFTRAGHTFTGWRTAATGGTAHAAGATINNVTAGITLFAQWTPNTYTIAYNANGGTGTMTSDNVTHGNNYTIKANTFTRAGHTFTGWRTTTANGGTTYAPSAQITNVQANITLFAQWTPVTYTVSFNANGGTGTMTSDNVNHGSNYTIKANTFTRAGHTFTGWRTAATGGTAHAAGAAINNVTGNITLFAQWTPITYTVSFNANGGTGTMTSDNVNHGSNYTIKANAFTRAGHTFTGWRTAATGGTAHAAGAAINNVTGNITLFAQWTPITYTVTFNANGGTGTMTVDNVNHGSNYTIKANTFTRVDHTFTGWSTAASGGTAHAAGATINNVAGNITLFAQWTASTSVLSTDRVIPPGGFDNGALTSGNTLAAEFTAGPNPVARAAGSVNFYRQGSRVDSGTLTVFDAAGNMVNKIRINDNFAGNQSRRIVGAWDLTDARGRQVSEGTYLVRGAVTSSDGKRERVSLMVGVR